MRFLVIILFFLAIFFTLDIYVFQGFKTVTANFKPGTRKTINIGYWLFSAALIVGMVLLGQFRDNLIVRSFGSYIFATFFTLIICKMIITLFLGSEDIYRLGRYMVNWFSNGSPSSTSTEGIALVSRKKFISQMAFITAGFPFLLSLNGVVRTAYDYHVKRLSLALKGIPENLRGLKIVQISDIHTGSFYSDEGLKKAVSMINELEPDLIFFTGDIVNNKTSEMEPYLDVLSTLKAKKGIFSILGNHDYGDYMFWKDAEDKKVNFDNMVANHEKMGWKLLRNENSVVEIDNAKLAVIGVENWSAKGHFKNYGDLDAALEGCDDCDVKLLLSHDPSHWDAEVRKKAKDVSITFSGHTHGFQFGIENKYFKWSPAQILYKQWAGLYQENDQYLYVNRGLGFLGYPGRIGIPPEITMITLT